MVLHPYELLGVSVNATVQEVRKRYYTLACLCHPDRGGTNDQMRVLHNAYQYVVQQVALNRTVTFEEMGRDFEEFCAAQQAEVPPFYDIHAEAFNLPKFNEVFEARSGEERVDGAFEVGGYETCRSEPTLQYEPTESRIVEGYQSELIVYKEPRPLVMPMSTVRTLAFAELDDFTCAVGKLVASDYKAALSPPILLKHSGPIRDVKSAFESMCAERLEQRA